MVYVEFRKQMQALVSPKAPTKPAAPKRTVDELTDAQVEAVVAERREYARLWTNYNGQMEAYGQRFDRIYTEFARALRAHYAPWATDAQAAVIHDYASETGHSSMENLEGQYDDYSAFAHALLDA